LLPNQINVAKAITTGQKEITKTKHPSITEEIPSQSIKKEAKQTDGLMNSSMKWQSIQSKTFEE